MSSIATNVKRHRRPLSERLDPWITLGIVVCLLFGTWTVAPLATGAIAPAQDDMRIELDVPITTSVTPGWTTGESSVELPNISMPGEPRDTSSSGWKMSTNWVKGYQVRIRATSDPALRGMNSIDGRGTRSSFADFKVGNCPCTWDVDAFQRGVFGYSATVSSSTGSVVSGATQWGTGANRRWRGFTREGFPLYSTAGGSGQFSMTIHLRSMIPDGAVQPEGSYRASFIVSAHPLS